MIGGAATENDAVSAYRRVGLSAYRRIGVSLFPLALNDSFETSEGVADDQARALRSRPGTGWKPMLH